MFDELVFNDTAFRDILAVVSLRDIVSTARAVRAGIHETEISQEDLFTAEEAAVTLLKTFYLKGGEYEEMNKEIDEYVSSLLVEEEVQ